MRRSTREVLVLLLDPEATRTRGDVWSLGWSGSLTSWTVGGTFTRTVLRWPTGAVSSNMLHRSQIRISSLTLRLTSRHYETLVNESELQQPRLRDLLISRCYLMFSDIFLNYLFISRPQNESLRLQSTCCCSAETLKVSIYSQLDSSGPSGGRLVVYR